MKEFTTSNVLQGIAAAFLLIAITCNSCKKEYIRPNLCIIPQSMSFECDSLKEIHFKDGSKIEVMLHASDTSGIRAVFNLPGRAIEYNHHNGISFLHNHKEPTIVEVAADDRIINLKCNF